MIGGIKKVYKKDLLSSIIYKVPPSLTGGVFFFGRIGSGKSVGMKALAEKYHDHPERKYKLFDVWGGERNEHLFWCLPSVDLDYWKKVKKKMQFKDEGPRQYKVNLLYPLTSNLPIDKLPSNPPFIKSKIFTIPVKSITFEDMSLSLGNLSYTKENRFVWRESIEQMTKKDGGAALEFYAEKLKGTQRTIYKSFITPLNRNCTLQSDICPYNLDIIEELKDRDTITVLCLEYVEKELKLFFLGYFLRMMAKAIDDGQAPRKNIVLLRETAEFFRATEQAVVPDEQKVFRTQLANYIRMGRRGLHLFLDAQSPSETHGLVDGSADLTIIGKLPSENDRISATNQLYRDNLITRKQIQDLGLLNPGEYLICETSKKVKKVYFFLPRTRYWKPGDNFYNIWKRTVDKWTSFVGDVDLLKKEYALAKQQLKERAKFEKMVDDSKKEIKTVKKETKKKEIIINEYEKAKREVIMKPIKSTSDGGLELDFG